MVLEKCVEVVYFRDMSGLNGFEAFSSVGVVAVVENGTMIIKGPFSKLLDMRVSCAGRQDGEPCACFRENVSVRVGCGGAFSEVCCPAFKARFCKILKSGWGKDDKN